MKMNKKINLINGLGAAYCLYGLLAVPNLMKLVTMVFSAPQYINQPATNDPSGKDMFILACVGFVVSLSSLVVPIFLGIGLIRRSNKIRVLTVAVNILVILIVMGGLFSTTNYMGSLTMLMLLVASTVILRLKKIKGNFKHSH